MYKRFKILWIASILFASCSQISVTDEQFIPVDKREVSNVSTSIGDVIKNNENFVEDQTINSETKEKNSEIKSDTLNEIELGDILKNSNVSYFAINLDTGKTLVDYRGENIATPASVMKIVTSATALGVLGEDTRLETKLVYDGQIDKNGVLNGNLYIIGSGDPTLGSENFKGDREEFLKNWIDDIKKVGINKVKGNMIVLDNLFGYEGVSGKWLLEDLSSSYGQGVYGISIFDNTCTIFINSNSKGGKIVKVVPNIPDLSFINNLKISEKGRNDASVRGLPFENKRTLIGEIPANRKNIVVKSDIPDPGLFLGKYFKEKLAEAKITITGQVETARKSKKRPKNPITIGVAQSQTIGDMVRVLLVKSDNHYTEHLYQLLKLRGIDIKEYWKEKGIDSSVLTMYDGSGLSRADGISAKMLTDILAYMYQNYPDYVELLPKAGYEGTVVGFLSPNRFYGEARVKSGSMSEVQSYAGYVEKNGQKVAFAIIINHWNGSRKEVKMKIEELVNQLF